MSTTSTDRLPSDLQTDQALSARVVHKAAIEQVLVTDWMPGPGEDWCTIAARLPLAHARFSDTAAPYHDILLIAEAVRQAGLVVAEEILKVQGDRQFLLRELKVELDPLEHARKQRDSCTLLISQDPASEVKMRPGRSMAGGMMRARLTIGGRPAGSCEVMGAWVPDSFYESLRTGVREETNGDGGRVVDRPAQMETRTGKISPANSVLSKLRRSQATGGHEASLVVDLDDPTFFDHPLDHVPGLYLLAGVQQLAIAAACEERDVDHSQVAVAGMRMSFSRIAELSSEVLCTVALSDDHRDATVACSQGGRLCCDGAIRLAYV